MIETHKQKERKVMMRGKEGEKKKKQKEMLIDF